MSNLAVLAHTAYEGSSALLCTELTTGNPVYWLEGIQAPHAFRLFDTCIGLEQARDINAQSNGLHWTARVSVSDLQRASSLQVPDPHVRYGEPGAIRRHFD